MTRDVVVAIDPAMQSPAPLELGRRLARALRARVLLVTVFPRHPLLEGPEDERQRAARTDAREALMELGRTLEDVEVADPIAITGTSPARSLQHVSEGADAAVVVVGSTSRGPLRRVVPGTVAERLLSGAACAVAVAPHGYGDEDAGDLAVIGVAYDGSEESRHALRSAATLARSTGARVRVMTVIPRVAFGGTPSSLTTPADSVNRVIERELREAHGEALGALEGDVTVDGVLERGDPGHVLAEQSRDLDILAAGSRGYGPLSAVLLGSATHALLRNAECPLLITPRGRGLDAENPAGDGAPPASPAS